MSALLNSSKVRVIWKCGSSLNFSHIYLRCPSKDWLFLSLCWALDNQAPTKLSSISLKPKTCADIYLVSWAERSQAEDAVSTLAIYSTLTNPIIKKGFSRGRSSEYDCIYVRSQSFATAKVSKEAMKHIFILYDKITTIKLYDVTCTNEAQIFLVIGCFLLYKPIFIL